MASGSSAGGGMAKHQHDADTTGAGGDVLAVASQLGIPTYATDGAAPNNSLYLNTGENQYKFKDSGGTVRDAEAAVPLYGDGSDGAITRSGNLNENGVIRATNYTLDAGVTATVTSGVLVILAQDSITINGTIDANGQGGAGGVYSSGGANTGTDGGTGAFAPQSVGGSGGTGGFNNFGGDGGDGDSATPPRVDLAVGGFPAIAETLHGGAAGAGGGSGAGGRAGVSEGGSGADGSAPGGGGGGQSTTGGSGNGAGGDGGNGGGAVVLVSPIIENAGTITADAQDGAAGGSNTADGGGGGGGSGGLILLVTSLLTESTPTYSVAAGSGGAAGGVNAGAGAAGEDGSIRKVVT